MGCAPTPKAITAQKATPPKTNPPLVATASKPPQWFVEDASFWIDPTESGMHRGVAGVRFETQGRRIVGVADEPTNLDGAHNAPPWSAHGKEPCRYVFWRDNEVFGAAEWLGKARSVGTLPTAVYGTFDWLRGVGLMSASGMFVVQAETCAVDKLEIKNAAAAFASSTERALVLTALGHARLTVDGAKTFSDVTNELPSAVLLGRAGGDLHVSTGTDELFVVNAQGISRAGKRLEYRPHNEPPPDPEDRWPAEHGTTSPLEAAVTNGLLLPSGEALAADGGLVARVSLETGRATEILRFGSEGETCMPVAVSDRALVVCEVGRRASVIDAGSGQVERSFDIEREVVWDRFVAVDGEALGFIGSCDGRNPAPPVDVVSSASAASASTQRSPIFCARTTSGTWVEHTLEAADATDLLAWIPRSDGGAVALVAVPGTFLHGVASVETRGSLRVVRVARNAPPLDVSTYMYETPKLVSRALRVLPDGSIEGWLSSGHSAAGQMAITIDSAGRARQHPLPARTSTLAASGRFALVRTDDNRYFESTDFGRSFQPIDPPPGRQSEPVAASAVGGQIGSLLRIGWGAQTQATPPEPTAVEHTPMLSRRIPPVVRLGCRFSGPPASSRISDGFGLGFTKTPMPQMAPGRISLAGAFYVPWRNVPHSLAGNAEFVFVPLLDLAAPVQRASVPLSRLESNERMSYEIRLGFVLDGTTAWPVAAERFSRCPAALVDEAGLTVPFGECVDDPTVGVAVDGRVFFMHAETTNTTRGRATIKISTAALTADRSGKTNRRGTNLEPLATHYVSVGIYPYKYAAGVRGKTPVLVAIDAAGSATLAPIDPARGTLGPEETLVSLDKLKPGNDAQCSEAPDDVRVLFPFTSEIGLAAKGLPGVRDSEHGGLAIIRWSSRRACLDAIDMSVHDERHEADFSLHIAQGPVRKLVARFDKPHQGKGTLAIITYGTEVRQPVVCEGASP
ncbi:MAG: hypothetical protein IPM54_34895 [Polyangiaceae bacterium]|nr:hypothetical protein [Polyangiaceae bacterium]